MSHEDARLDEFLRVHELLRAIEEEAFLGDLFTQIEHNDLVCDGDLEQVDVQLSLATAAVGLGDLGTVSVEPLDAELCRAGHIRQMRVFHILVGILHHHLQIDSSGLALAPLDVATLADVVQFLVGVEEDEFAERDETSWRRPTLIAHRVSVVLLRLKNLGNVDSVRSHKFI